MTFLELCQALRQEAGISGTGPAAVTGRTGEEKKIVDWINRAWLEIQNLHPDWQFLHSDFAEFTMTTGTDEYTAASLNITDFGLWDRNFMRVKTSTADEQIVRFLPWQQFRTRYKYGVQTTGKPYYFTISPSHSLVFAPNPDADYLLNGSYYKHATELAADADEPALPSQYHNLILYRALMHYATHHDAPEVHQEARRNYLELLGDVRRHELPMAELRGRAFA